MGRGRSKLAGGIVASRAQQTANRIANQTRNLEDEQLRTINENGEVTFFKQGNGGEVAFTVGEGRQYGPGSVTIHNHPDGGPFSSPDLRFFGYGARAIIVAAPEGDYKMVNNKYGTKEQADGWLEMQKDMDRRGITKEYDFLELRRKAEKAPKLMKKAARIGKLSEAYVKAHNEGKPRSVLENLEKRYDVLAKEYREDLQKEERRIVIQPYEDYYRKNASKYGFTYSFKRKTEK